MWMVNLNEIRSTDEVKDDAERWAIWEEFTSRQEAYERAKVIEREGIVGVMKRFRRALIGEAVEMAEPDQQALMQEWLRRNA